MGYRSDVAYVIKFGSIEHRDNFVTLMLAKNDKHLSEAIEETKHDYKKDPIITFYETSQKWYESYPDVQAHHQLMRDAVELFEGEYRFVRVGEDNDDLEVQADGEYYDLYDYVYPIREIGTDFPAE